MKTSLEETIYLLKSILKENDTGYEFFTKYYIYAFSNIILPPSRCYVMEKYMVCFCEGLTIWWVCSSLPF